jgi:hypothetical protein
MPSEAIRPVTTAASGIQNGSIVTLVFNSGAGSVQKRAPDFNQHAASGAMNIRTSGRFDDVRYYTGDLPS